MTMSKEDRSAARAVHRRQLLKLMLAGGALGGLAPASADEHRVPDGLHNSLNWAVAWKQTAAE